MKKLTISDIKDILRIELEKSKRHVQHYYLGTNRFSETDRLKSILNNQEQEDQFRQQLKQNYRQTLKELNPKVNQVLDQQGYDPVTVDSLEFKQLREELIQLKLDQFEQKRVLLSEETNNVGGSVELETRESVSNPVKQEPTEDGSILLSDLCDRFIKSRAERDITPRTLIDCQNSTNLLLEVVGDIPVDSLAHSDGRELVQTLKKLPKNRKSRYPNKTINELVEMENVELISDKTVGKLFSKIITLFNWSINQGYVKENFFQGKLDSTPQKQTLEKHFTPSELELICAESLKKDSVDKNRPERYWVTLISLYSGSRLNEICQMNLSDIEEQDGIWVMNLIKDSEDKNIKTQSGNRVVPLHPKLIDLGLLNYVAEIKNKNETKLFPNLKRSELSSYGTLISQWFGRYLKNLGIKKKGKNFHSFRHTVVNHLTSKQVYQPFIKELVGHSHGTMTMDVYGGRKPLEVLLNECVVKLDYGIEGEESE
ncbi:MAG: site-specific integrase [Dehalococcoidia bacterium]|jgi:integrase|nr:site-specific integrase [Dehalococcoidia bacterium]